MILKNNIKVIALALSVGCLISLSSISHSTDKVGSSNVLTLESQLGNINVENFSSDESALAFITNIVQHAYNRFRHGPRPPRDANGRPRLATGGGDEILNLHLASLEIDLESFDN